MPKVRSRSRHLPALAGLLLALALSACAPLPRSAGSAPADAVIYELGREEIVRQLYPDASWLPPDYQAIYPDLGATIAHYTTQSLQRDGVADAQVDVSFPERDGVRVVQISIAPRSVTTERYASLHPQFLDTAHAQQALKGVQACQAASGCWDPAPRKDQPWAFFLPLGLPLATQQSVLFLNYPPIPALTGRDYLNNFTMCRWGRVMGAAGATDAYAYETIVDARPIAAPGSGEEPYLPDPLGYFDDDSGASGRYITPMLSLLVEREGSAPRPVAVFGTPARKTWGQIIGQSSVQVLDVGTAALGAQAPTVPWIATNHPDVTTYNCCPGDPASACGGSTGLVLNEQKDFVTACWLIRMASTPGLTPEAARTDCRSRWMDAPGPAERQALCVQAKLDNNNPAAVCDSYTSAWEYCAAHDANPCATFDCRYDPARVAQPLPPPAQRPAGWEQTCNGFRH